MKNINEGDIIKNLEYPDINEAHFVCMLDGDKLYYSDDNTYTLEEIKEYLESKRVREYAEMMAEYMQFEEELARQNHLYIHGHL